MSGDAKHIIGIPELILHCDGFDVECDIFSLKCMYHADPVRSNRHITNGFIRSESGLLRILSARNDCYNKFSVICRSFEATRSIGFKLNINGDHAFNPCCRIRNFKKNAVQIYSGKRVCYILLTGNIRYTEESGIITLSPGKSELVFSCGDDPAAVLRNLYKYLNGETGSDPIENEAALDCILPYIHNDGWVKEYTHPILPHYIFSISAKRLFGCNIKLPELNYDEKALIHGMMPCKKCDDGSAIDTILYIYAKGRSSNRASAMFRENFIRGDKAVLNSRKRRENCRQPRFRYGNCQYCDEIGWLEKTVHGSYACINCFSDANKAENIPPYNEYLSDIPLLLMIYLGMDTSAFGNVNDILKRISKNADDPLILGLLLYATCTFDMDEMHDVYKSLIHKRNELGIWHGVTPCCPVTNAICCVAVEKYKIL